MASSMEQCMRTNPQILSERLKAFVHPKADAKTLARWIGCDVRTAENIRRGTWPIARHWLGLINTFGEDLTEAVFHPERALARMEQEARELEARLLAKKAEIRDVARGLPSRQQPHRPVQDRPAVSRAGSRPAEPQSFQP